MRYITLKLELFSDFFASYYLFKPFFDFNSSETSTNLIPLTFLVTLRPFSLLQPKLRVIKRQKNPENCHNGWHLFRSFQWGWNLVLKEFQVWFRTFFRKIKKMQASIWLFLINLTVKKKILQTTSFIIFWDFSMFYQTFLPPQTKRSAINTYKHGKSELPHELPNVFTLRISGN